VTRAREQYIADCEERGTEPNPHFLVDVKLHDLRHESASRYAEKNHIGLRSGRIRNERLVSLPLRVAADLKLTHF
jgi:hypothetical protein